MVQRVLGLKKLFKKNLALPLLCRSFYILFITNSKDHWVQRITFDLLIN